MSKPRKRAVEQLTPEQADRRICRSLDVVRNKLFELKEKYPQLKYEKIEIKASQQDLDIILAMALRWATDTSYSVPSVGLD